MEEEDAAGAEGLAGGKLGESRNRSVREVFGGAAPFLARRAEGELFMSSKRAASSAACLLSKRGNSA